MKPYHTFASLLMGLSIILIQPQLTAAHFSGGVANSTATQVTVSSTGQYPGSGVIVKREDNPATVLNTTHEAVILANKHEATPTSTSPPEDFVHLGNDMYDLDDYDSAIKAYTQAIRLNPGYSDAYRYRARAFLDIANALRDGGDKTGSDEVFRRVQEDNNQAERIDAAVRRHVTQGNDKYLRGDYEGAIAAYTQALKINPSDAWPYLFRGNARNRLKEYQGAIEDYNQALKINPNDADAYSFRGNARSGLKDYQGAIEDFTQSLRIDPNNEIAYRERGLARALGDQKGAIEDYNQALKINPNDAFAYSFRGNARSGLKDYQGAIEDFTQSLRIDPNNEIAYRERGNARARLGDQKGAIEDYNQALRINPNDADTRRKRDILRATNASLFSSAILCLVWLISISLHGFGQAITAYWGGDRSVKAKGYLTLNPLNYAHPSINIIPPSLLFIYSAFVVPITGVYIQRQQLQNRGWQSAVSAAGPLTSLIITLLLFALFQVSSAWNLPYWLSATLALSTSFHFFSILFDLMPYPPFNGYGIIEPWLPTQLQGQLRRATFMWFIAIAIWVLVVLPWLSPMGLFMGESFIGKSVVTLTQMLGIPTFMALDGFELFNRWYLALFLGAVGVVALIRQPQAVWHSLGNVLSKLKMYKLALAAYDKAVKGASNDWRAWTSRGWVLVQLERDEEALISYNKAVELQPGNFWVWISRGSMLNILWRHEEAIQSFDQAIHINPNHYIVWEGRGLALYCLSRYEEAITAFDRLLELKPDTDWAYWSRRGSVLKGLERYEEALSAYDTAVELAPKDFLIWRNRGEVLKELDRYEEALVAYNRAIKFRTIKSDPLLVGGAWLDQGSLLEKLGRYDEALAAYDQIVKESPKFTLVWERRGWVLKQLKRYDEAFASYSKEMELDLTATLKPDSAWDWRNRGLVLEKLDRYEEALASYNKAIELNPNDLGVWYLRGMLLKQLKRYEESLAAYDQAIELNPNEAWVWQSRGWLLAESLQRYEDAIQSFDRAFQTGPIGHRYSSAWSGHGWALYNLQRYKEAITSFDKAIELKPDYDFAWYNRARSYALQDNIKQAIENLHHAIELNPNKWQESAKTDSAFAQIRENERFS